MTWRTSAVYLLLASIFIVNLVGASRIALTDSDRSPFEQRFAAQCAKPEVSVVFDDATKPNPKVIEVVLTGDFSACKGSQVLVSAYKTGHIHSYAVAEISSTTQTISLRFDKKVGTGDFYQKFPQVVAGRLVSDGPLAPSNPSIDPSEIQVTFAWSWS
jgi:hypothetical protein